MKIAYRPLAAALLAMGFACQAAHGQTMPRFKFSGFGTIAATHSTEENADFVTSLVQPNGSGHSHDWTFNTDSRAGLQADVIFNDQFSGVVQVVSRQHADNSFTPQFEWANVKYQ